MKKIIASLVLIIAFIASGIFLFSKEEEEEITNPVYEEKEEGKSEEVTRAKLTFVGDLLFETAYYNAINRGEDKNLYFSLVSDYFLNDDLSIGNMEVIMGNENIPVSGGDNYNFAAPSWVGDLVATLDFEILSTANNHAFDQGRAGVISTIDFFQNHSDILTVGTYKTLEDATKLSILEINRIRFGFLAYAMGTNVKMSESNEYMVSLYKSNYKDR